MTHHTEIEFPTSEIEARYEEWLHDRLSDQEARERDYRAVGEWLTDHYAPPWMLDLVLEKLA